MHDLEVAVHWLRCTKNFIPANSVKIKYRTSCIDYRAVHFRSFVLLATHHSHPTPSTAQIWRKMEIIVEALNDATPTIEDLTIYPNPLKLNYHKFLIAFDLLVYGLLPKNTRHRTLPKFCTKNTIKFLKKFYQPVGTISKWFSPRASCFYHQCSIYMRDGTFVVWKDSCLGTKKKSGKYRFWYGNGTVTSSSLHSQNSYKETFVLFFFSWILLLVLRMCRRPTSLPYVQSILKPY